MSHIFTYDKAKYNIPNLITAKKVLSTLPSIPNKEIYNLAKKYKSRLSYEIQSTYPSQTIDDEIKIIIYDKYKILPFEHIFPSMPITHAPVIVPVATCSNVYNSNINYIIKYNSNINYIIKYIWINICFLVVFILVNEYLFFLFN
jgi:hypothetical protein